MKTPSFLGPLAEINGIRADWIPRIPNVDVQTDRETALARLRPYHDSHIAQNFPSSCQQHYAEQIHGDSIHLIKENHSERETHPSCDGLLTQQVNQTLAICVADCAAIYLVDPVQKAIGLLHSGKKGTELNILATAVDQMRAKFHSQPANLICIISPCICPPDYEIDITQIIQKQAQALNIGQIHAANQNTAADLNQFYSYRAEKGKTGRMLALLAITDS